MVYSYRVFPLLKKLLCNIFAKSTRCQLPALQRTKSEPFLHQKCDAEHSCLWWQEQAIISRLDMDEGPSATSPTAQGLAASMNPWSGHLLSLSLQCLSGPPVLLRAARCLSSLRGAELSSCLASGNITWRKTSRNTAGM